MLFRKFITVASIVLVGVIATTSAHARGWKVLDTWEKTSSPVVRMGDPTFDYVYETRTEQFTDGDGNTVERVLKDRFRTEVRIETTTVTHYPYMKEERCRGKRCRERTRRGRPYATTTQRVDTQKNHQETTVVSETIVKYATVAKEETTTTSTTASLDFGDDAQYLGTRTEMVSNESSYYLNLDEFRSTNEAVNQDKALARGWTGKGSTIAILDSGIDVDHAEFDTGKIKYTYDFTQTGIQDNVGHGSHVASIAAGEMDGTGMMGIAPDADLAIIKITNNWSSSMSFARKGIEWAKANTDAVVANISSNTNYSSDYKNHMTYQGDGIYTNDHVYYGGSNYYNLEDPNRWASALADTEMVVTVSAGNASNGYVQNPATFATATDANGDLLLDGRMLIVGNWNTSTNTVEGANSGHVCKDYSGGQCNDAYTTSDFYILAPGQLVSGADHDGDYRNFSGTSQAAPVVAGAVAVVHQMWPYMKGENIAQLLLQTADKTIEGYSEDTHGQGLLDLDRATQPIGDLGISLTGREGTTTELSGGIALAGVDDSALSSLSSVSAVDEIGRDYTVNLKPAAHTMNSMIPIYQLDHSVGSAWSSKFVGGAQEARGMYFGTYETPHTLDRQSFTNVTVGFDDTLFQKRNPVSGAVMDPSAWTTKFMFTQSYGSPYMAFGGMWGQVESSQTFELSQLYKPNNWYGQVGVMYTTTQFKQGLVTEVDPITAMYGVAGWSNDNLNLYVGIKPTVVSGNVHLNVPTSVDAGGTMHYSSVKASMRGEPVSYVGAQFSVKEHKDRFNNEHSLKMNGVVDQYGDSRVGAYWSMEF